MHLLSYMQSVTTTSNEFSLTAKIVYDIHISSVFSCDYEINFSATQKLDFKINFSK